MDSSQSLLFSAASSETGHAQPLTASPSPASPRLVSPLPRASSTLLYPPSVPDASFSGRHMPTTGNAVPSNDIFVGTSETEVDSSSVSYQPHSPLPPLGAQGDRSYDWDLGGGIPRRQPSPAAKESFASLSNAPASSPGQPSAFPTESDDNGDDGNDDNNDNDDNDNTSLQTDVSELSLELEGTAPTVELFTHQPHLRTHHAGADSGATVNQTSNARPTDNSRSSVCRKRAAPDSDADGQSESEPGEDQGDGSGTGHSPGNQEALQTLGAMLSCPYRKRNKERFNYRTHERCTVPFKDISRVKEHVKKHHVKAATYKCSRCWLEFPSEEDLSQHQRLGLSEICRATERPQRKDNPEDGITARVSEILAVRHAGKVPDWKTLWKTLFTDDTETPSPVHEKCLVAETNELVEVTEKVRIRTIERLQSRFADMIRNGDRADPDTLASQLVTQADDILREGNADYLGELERRILQESPSGSTTARSKRGRQDKKQTTSRSLSQRPPFSSPAPIAPESRAAAQLSPPVSLPPHPIALAQFHLRHMRQETKIPSPLSQCQVWSAHTPQATDSVASASPLQNSVLHDRRHQLLSGTQWVGSESTRQDFQIGMQQAQPITQSTFTAAQPSSGDIYPSHPGPVFYPDPRQPNAPQAQGHGTFPYGTQPSEYYQNTTQGSFDSWQHMPGSDGGQREG